jgi:4-hydroxy-tetrahydrodipicolinate synthase
MVEVVHAALNGDLVGARKARKLVDPLARIVYNFGEPSGDAHQRMKCARWLIGQFPSMTMRKPLRQLPTTEVEKIRQHLELIGYECKN